MNKAFRIAPLALLLLSSSVLAGDRVPLTLDQILSQAQDQNQNQNQNLQIGTGVICDTRDEVQRFVSLMDQKDAGEALQTVNREKENPLACGMATVAFSSGKDHGDVRNGKGAFKILEIEIVAGATEAGWQKIEPRRTQFTAIELPGLEI